MILSHQRGQFVEFPRLETGSSSSVETVSESHEGAEQNTEGVQKPPTEDLEPPRSSMRDVCDLSTVGSKVTPQNPRTVTFEHVNGKLPRATVTYSQGGTVLRKQLQVGLEREASRPTSEGRLTL